MAMFDIIIVEDKLPWTDEMWAEGLPNACTDFQTKGLNNSLSTYKIEQGKLWVQKFKEGKRGFDHTEQLGEYWEELSYHGVLAFYNYYQNDKPGNNDCFIEFQATFTNGIMNKIEVFKFEKADNTERIESWNQMMEEMATKRARWSNRFFFHTKPVRWVNRCVHKALYHTGNFFTKLSYKF